MGFIYKVTNTKNQKVYIGQTRVSVDQRFKQHLYDSKKNWTSENRPFYNAIKKYGDESFIVETIEEVPNEQLNEREKYWIQYYRSYVHDKQCNGYNATLGGDSTQYYDYKEIANFYLQNGSMTETAKYFGCCLETVTRAKTEFGIDTINKSGGRPIECLDENHQVIKKYSCIREAAKEIAESQRRNFATVRKRINKVVLHQPEQKAYGFFWRNVS